MRKVDMRFPQMSARSCESGCTLASRRLHIRIDGLGQAKCCCPHNLEPSKHWSTLWRPQLHIVGVTVEGLFEQYWVWTRMCPKTQTWNAHVSRWPWIRRRICWRRRICGSLNSSPSSTTTLGGMGKNSTPPSGCHGSSTMALLDKCRMAVASLGIIMALWAKDSQPLL